MKTSSEQVINKLYSALQHSALKNAVSGSLYKSGLRPLNQVAEDIVVNFVSGTADQIQEGVANVNVFVPDIDNGAGALVQNTARCRALEVVANTWADTLASADSEGYRFELDSMVETMQYEDKKQHFINLRLKFYYVTF